MQFMHALEKCADGSELLGTEYVTQRLLTVHDFQESAGELRFAREWSGKATQEITGSRLQLVVAGNRVRANGSVVAQTEVQELFLRLFSYFQNPRVGR